MDMALFSPSSLFADSDGDGAEEGEIQSNQNFEKRRHQFPGMAIFLHKSFAVDITTTDYDDAEIEENIAYNCQINGVVPVLPHVRHSWGDEFPISNPKWDLIIASTDILLYVKQYPNLIKSFSFLLKSYESKAIIAISSSGDDACLLPRPAFLMNWRSRTWKEDESLLFTGCEKAGLAVSIFWALVCIAFALHRK